MSCACVSTISDTQVASLAVAAFIDGLLLVCGPVGQTDATGSEGRTRVKTRDQRAVRGFFMRHPVLMIRLPKRQRWGAAAS